MRALQWLAASLLLMVLMVGVALVVAFIIGAGSVVGLLLGASLVVAASPGLLRLEPRTEGRRAGMRQRRFSTLHTHSISLETSIGRVQTDVWSDGLVAVEGPLGGAEADGLAGPDDLQAALQRVGVPADEAASLAAREWAQLARGPAEGDPEGADVLIGYYRGPLDQVLLAIDQAGLAGAVIELFGYPDDELTAFVGQKAQAHPELAARNRAARGRKGFLGFRSGRGPLVLPIEGANLRELVALMEHHADPEVAIELQVIKEGACLVWAPDVGDNEIWVSRDLSPATRRTLIQVLGGDLTTHPK